MSDVVGESAVAGPDAPVLTRLSFLDRFLPVWIIAAMAAGIGLGRAIPGLAGALDKVEIGSVSLPIAVGLLLMMYPVLAKVRYGELDRVTGDRRLLVTSLVLNWVVGPALMFALAWLLLPDQPTYRTGLIIVGLARCIAMVLIWNDLSCGDREAAAVLVAINSVFQIVAFACLGWFYLQVLPGLARPAPGTGRLLDRHHRPVGAGVPRHPPARRLPDPHRSASGAEGRSGTRTGSCPGSAPSRSTGCSSRSWCCSPCRGTPSRPGHGTSCGSRFRC